MQDASSKQKQNKNKNPIISRQDYPLIQPCPSEEKQTSKQKLSTNFTLYNVYPNHWTKLRRAETKRKKEFSFEDWEKETSNKIIKKKKERKKEKAEKYYTNEGTN